MHSIELTSARYGFLMKKLTEEDAELSDEDRKILRKRFTEQKRRAHQRKIVWSLSEEEWFDFWLIDNRWKNRGTSADNFVMSRIGDSGAYSKDNVTCQTQKENGLEHAALVSGEGEENS